MTKRTGYLFQRREGGNWYLQFNVDGNRFIKSTGTPNRRQAEKRRLEILEPFLLGDEKKVFKAVADKLEETTAKIAKLEDELNPPPTLDLVFLRFMQSPERPDAGERTLQGYQSSWKRFAVWMSEKHPAINYLHEITPQIAKNYAQSLKAAKVSPSTYNQHKNLLAMVWRVLADECRLTDNPWTAFKSMKSEKLKSRKRALTDAQLQDLFAAVESDPDLKDLFTLLAWTGLRRIDAVLMKWSAVDFAKGVISLAPRKTARTQGKLVHIPIFPAVEDVLNRRHNGLMNPGGFVFPELAEQYQHDPTKITKTITQAFERAGMQTSEERAGRGRAVCVYGAHSLRHYFVTVAASAGMPGAMIKSITGHATDDMMEHYTHIGADFAAKMAGDIRANPTRQIAMTAPQDRAAEIKELVEKLDGKNWKEIKEKLTALV